MKKIVLLVLLVISAPSLEGQTLDWVHLFDIHSENGMGGWSKNTLKDSQNRLITAVVESDVLKLYQFDADGNMTATLNTQMECGGFTPMIRIQEDQFALVYDHTPAGVNATYKLLIFNADLAIIQETELHFPESDFFTFGSFFSFERTLYFSAFTCCSHFLYSLNSNDELVLRYQSAISNAHVDQVKTLSNGQIIFEYGEGLNHQLRCIAAPTGTVLWEKQFVNDHLDTIQLNYRTTLGEQQTIYLAGLERTWISGVAHDVIQFRAIDTQSGAVLNENTFALTDGGTVKIDDLKYNPANQHLYLSYLSNGAVQDEVVLEFDQNFNRVHQARLAYSYDALSAWVNSKVIIRDNGGLAFIYTNYKNLEEHGNLHIANMNADLTLNGALELNVPPKNSSESFSHALLYDDDQLVLTGYIPNPEPMIGFEEVQFYLAMIHLDRLLNTEQPAEHPDQPDLLLFPNPATNTLYVQTKFPIDTISIWNSLGQQVKLVNTAEPIDISSLDTGIYLIVIASNNKVWKSKLIKI